MTAPSSSASSKIRVLPPELASQIAAGEVVERPASVVKELVENALDAGARKITVSIANGGTDLIRVSDDGCGMTAQDAATAFQPHATSKLHSVEDLAAITTLGFRGEALPSIASVSKMRLVTRTQEDPTGTVVQVEGTEPILVSQTGCAPGTVVEVADLFFNVPARRKFLKKPSTEANHCLETVVRLAMVRPDVHFIYEQDGRIALDLTRQPELRQRAEDILARRVRGGLFHASQQRGQTRVEVLAAGPGDAVRSARSCYFFVNRRFVKDRILLKALTGGFGPVLAQGQYPVALVLVEVPADQVDVNVHPQKFEVRFRQERDVAAALRVATADLVAQAPWSALSGQSLPVGGDTAPVSGPVSGGRVVSGDGGHTLSESSRSRYGDRAREARQRWPEAPGKARPRAGAFAGPGQEDPLGSSFVSTGPSDYFRPLVEDSFPGGDPGRQPRRQDRESADRERQGIPEAKVMQRSLQQWAGDETSVQWDTDSPVGLGRGLRSMRYVGQVLGTYLLFESQGELVVMDQHAAHERVNYNRIMARLTDASLVSQRLLVPRTVYLDGQEVDAVDQAQQTLSRFGFEVEAFGPGTFALKAVPALIVETGGDPESAFSEVVSLLADPAAAQDPASLVDHMAATLACHASIRAGHRMEAREVTALLEALEQPGPWDHCPHGRPILFRMSRSELERRFHRS